MSTQVAPIQRTESDYNLTNTGVTGTQTYAVGSVTWASGGSSTALNSVAAFKGETMDSGANGEVEVTVNAPTGTYSAGGPCARFRYESSLFRGYFVRETTAGQPGSWDIVKYNGSTATTLGTLNVPSITSYGVSMKFAAQGSRLYLKVWASGGTEPSWASTTNVLVVTDTTYGTTGGSAFGIGTWGLQASGDKVSWSGLKFRPAGGAIGLSTDTSSGATDISDTTSNGSSYTTPNSITCKAYEPLYIFVYNTVGTGTAGAPTVTAPSGVTVSGNSGTANVSSTATDTATFAATTTRRVSTFTAQSTTDVTGTWTISFAANQSGCFVQIIRLWGADNSSSDGSSALSSNKQVYNPNTSLASITGTLLAFTNAYGVNGTVASVATNLNDAPASEGASAYNSWYAHYSSSFGTPAAAALTESVGVNDTSPNATWGSATAQRVMISYEVVASDWAQDEYNKSGDTGSGTDAVSALVPSWTGIGDTGSGTDAVSALAASPSGSDTGAATEAESVEVIGGATDITDSDTGSGTDAVSDLTFSSTQDDPSSGADAVTDLTFASTQDDPAAGTDALSALAASVTDDEPASGADALSALAADATDNDPASGVEAGTLEAAVAADEPASGTEAVTEVAVAATDDDPATGTDAGSVAADVPGADTGAGTDAETAVEIAATVDEPVGSAEAGTLTVEVSDDDTATATEAGEAFAGQQITDDDTATAVEDQQISAGVDGADTGSATDSESIFRALSDDDPATGTEAGSVDADVSGSDTAAAAESESIDISTVEVSDGDTVTGTDGQEILRASSDDDTASAADAGSLAADVSGSDTATSAEAESVAVALVEVSDDDTASAVDDGALVVAVAGADDLTGDEGQAIALTAADDGTATDAEALTIPVNDADSVNGTDDQQLAAAVGADDAGSGADLVVVVLLGDAETGTFTEDEYAYNTNIQADKWVAGAAQSAWKLRDSESAWLLREALGAWGTAEVSEAWSIGEALTPWTIGRLGEENELGIMEISQYSAQYVRVPVEAILAGAPVDVSTYTVQMALTALDDDNPTQEWGSATWEVDTTTNPTTYYARKVVGPLSPGAYKVWVKVTAGPETPVLKVPTELIVR